MPPQNTALIAAFNGTNQRELADRFKLTLNAVYRIIQDHRGDALVRLAKRDIDALNPEQMRLVIRHFLKLQVRANHE